MEVVSQIIYEMLRGYAPQHDEGGFPYDDALEIFSPSPMLCGVKVRGWFCVLVEVVTSG